MDVLALLTPARDRPLSAVLLEGPPVRVTGKGDLYVHQDANCNVIGVSDMGGSLVERYFYSNRSSNPILFLCHRVADNGLGGS